MLEAKHEACIACGEPLSDDAEKFCGWHLTCLHRMSAHPVVVLHRQEREDGISFSLSAKWDATMRRYFG